MHFFFSMSKSNQSVPTFLVCTVIPRGELKSLSGVQLKLLALVHQAAFCVRFPEDLRRGFPNRSAYWRMIVVFDVKRRKTEPVPRRRV